MNGQPYSVTFWQGSRDEPAANTMYGISRNQLWRVLTIWQVIGLSEVSV